MSSALSPEEIQRRYSQQAGIAQQRQQSQPASRDATFGERALGALEQAPAKQVQLLNSVFGEGVAELKEIPITEGRAKGSKRLEVYFRGKPFDPEGLDVGDAADFLVPAVTDLVLPLLASRIGGQAAEEVASAGAKNAAKGIVKEFILAAGKSKTVGQRIAGGVASGLTGLALRKGATAAVTGGEVLPGSETGGEALLAAAAPVGTEAISQVGRAAFRAPGAILRAGIRASSPAETAASKQLVAQTGIELTPAQQAESSIGSTLQGLSGRFIGTKDIAVNKIKKQISQAETFANKTLDAITGTSGTTLGRVATTADKEAAGTNAGRAVNAWIDKLKEGRRELARYNYGNLAREAAAVPFSTSETKAELADILKSTLASAGPGSRKNLREDVAALAADLDKSDFLDGHSFIGTLQDIRDKISSPELRPKQVSGSLSDHVYRRVENSMKRDLAKTVDSTGNKALGDAVSVAESEYARDSQEINNALKSVLVRTVRGVNPELLKDGEKIVSAFASGNIGAGSKAVALKALKAADANAEASLVRNSLAEILESGASQGPQQKLGSFSPQRLSTTLDKEWDNIRGLMINHPEELKRLDLLRKSVRKLAETGDASGSSTQVALGLGTILGGLRVSPGGTVASLAASRYLTAALFDNESALLLPKIFSPAINSRVVRRSIEALSKPEIAAAVNEKFLESKDNAQLPAP